MEEFIKIRSAKKSDLIACEKIGRIKEFKVSTGDYFKVFYLKYYLSRNFFLVAEKNKKLIGFLVAEKIRAHGATIWYIAVDKKERNKGIGTKMINEFEKRIKKDGIEWAILYCPDYNLKSKNFYRKSGYNEQEKLVEFEKFLFNRFPKI